ncbi:hypothetical protein [Cellulomonas bogoriensis]|nr:hypothetical protein [Cellulomonas bogoriensis]
MTGQVEIESADVRDAARAVGAAGDAAAAVDHPEHVAALAAALPGSRSANAARRLRTAWRDASTGWVDEARTQQARLDATVTATLAADTRATTRASRLAGRLGPVTSPG